MDFLNFLLPQLEKAARALTVLEIAGVLFNLVAVILTIRANVLNFPLGIIACLLTFTFFWKIQLFAEATLQIFYLALLLYGWWNWLRPQQNTTELPVRFAPPNGFAVGLLCAGFGGAVGGFFLHRLTPSPMPFWDAGVAVFSILGQYFVARKWVENWPIWVGANIVSVGIMWQKEAYLYSMLYLFFIALAVLGWREWTQKTAS